MHHENGRWIVSDKHGPCADDVLDIFPRWVCSIIAHKKRHEYILSNAEVFARRFFAARLVFIQIKTVRNQFRVVTGTLQCFLAALADRNCVEGVSQDVFVLRA